MTAYVGDDIPLPEMPPLPEKQKDTPVAYSAPEYRMAGTTIGGENVIECAQCGALMKEGNTFLHTHWHERMNNLRVTY